MANLETFRQETRAWLEANCPESMRQPGPASQEAFYGGRNAEFFSQDQRIWFERMVEKGWTVPYWPTEYGGGGLSKEEFKILQEEMRNLKCPPPLVGFGIWMLGPVVLKYGTEEQKQKYIPEITRGEVRWCQGYSEPGAGSDLASLQTRAISDGDDYVINGSKIWTSYANVSDAIFCLVRTDASTKHGGVSFLLVDDMKAAGVHTKPIKLISGQSPFCETYFDNVRVPKKNLIGKENQGWEVGMYLLQHERTNISMLLFNAGDPTVDVAREYVGMEDGKLANPVLRQELARLEMRNMALRHTGQRVQDETESGQSAGHTSAALKYASAEFNKARNELLMSLTGFHGLGWEGEQFDEGQFARSWLRTKANSIEGGTSEIQLNIISKRVLELPR